LYADCLIVRGQCKAVVCAVGTNSSRGERKHKLETDVDTDLQHKLKNLANRFTIYALYAALSVFLVLIITMIITLSGEKDWAADLFDKLAKDFNVCIILLVVSIPEGLPLTVGVSLAFSVRKMLND
jgi:magnesium-transporting ATPase (P-type)